jgi:maltose/moltooligosaccharide transporter
VAPRRELALRQIWNMCFGFFGIQFGLGLQNANISRIFQTLGAQLDDVPILWIAGPLTGLIVQPLVGYLSDRTRSRLGRRRPYFLLGAVLSAIALIGMPQAHTLWFATVLLWLLDASINISMEPFRAMVGDLLPLQQRATGYAMQSFFIATGALIASALPWLLATLGLPNTAPAGVTPDTVRYAFYIGAAVFVAAVAWTVATTPEPSLTPREPLPEPAVATRVAPARSRRAGLRWAGAGAGALAWLGLSGWPRSLGVLAIGASGYGLALLWLARGTRDNVFSRILTEVHAMPDRMRRLAWVQFFSFFAMFPVWVYTTAAVTEVQFGSSDPRTLAYNAGANWVGVMFATYNAVSAITALAIPALVRRWGLRAAHVGNLWLGALGLGSFLLIRDPRWLLLSMAGVGVAWASILSLPYAALSRSAPDGKMGLTMGIFNLFIVIPQLLGATLLGPLLDVAFHGRPIWAMAVAGASLFAAGLCTLRLRESDPGPPG